MWTSHIIKQIRFWKFTIPSDPKALLYSPRNAAAFGFLVRCCELFFLSSMGDSETGLAEPQISASELFYSTEEKHTESFMVWTPKEKREANLWRKNTFLVFSKEGRHVKFDACQITTHGTWHMITETITKWCHSDICWSTRISSWDLVRVKSYLSASWKCPLNAFPKRFHWSDTWVNLSSVSLSHLP